jgi:hypothetical protein
MKINHFETLLRLLSAQMYSAKVCITFDQPDGTVITIDNHNTSECHLHITHNGATLVTGELPFEIAHDAVQYHGKLAAVDAEQNITGKVEAPF